ncbi:MAG: dihydrolipoyl dehydrogenase [Candidatus Diapherotrites archaeon]
MVVGEMTEHADVAVIGSGPGGYVAAIRAGQLGKNVILIEKDPNGLGGICLHHGCIPSKALIHTANLFWEATHAKEQGIFISTATIDMEQTQSFKEKVVAQLTNGIKLLCEKAGVDIVYGNAYFRDSKTLHVEMAHDTMTLTADNIIIATGAKEREHPRVKVDNERIISSTEILGLKKIPSTLAVIGSGYIAMEMAHTFQKFGSQVTIIHRSPTILNHLDPQVGEMKTKLLQKLGVSFLPGVDVMSSEINGNSVVLRLQSKDGKSDAKTFEQVLVAIGRDPLTQGLSLENTKVKVDEQGFILVDERCYTSDSSILAIGDVTGEPQLAHRAMYMGKIAGEVCAGLSSAYNATVCPAVMYSDPEVAWVGIQSNEAQKAGRSILSGKFPFSANGRALGANQPDGYVQLNADPLSHVILGGIIVGEHASDMISQIGFAIEMGARLEDMAGTIHPHPTFDEAILEAADDALGKCVHLPFRKKKNV